MTTGPNAIDKLNRIAPEPDEALRDQAYANVLKARGSPDAPGFDVLPQHTHQKLKNKTSEENILMVWVVWRSDDEMNHVFSTQEKAVAYSESLECSCVISDYTIDHPERMYERTQ